MGAYPTIDYFKLAKEFDFVALDCYPFWHVLENQAENAALAYTLTRSLKKTTFPADGKRSVGSSVDEPVYAKTSGNA